MTTHLPTPTEAALAAAREIHPEYSDEWLKEALSKPSAMHHAGTWRALNHAANLRRLDISATILTHFQSLLAKVEGERDAVARSPDIGQDPLKLDGEERIAYRSDEVTLARLQKATSLQQKEVPDQTALVWRADLNWLIGQFIWRQAGHRHAIDRNKRIEDELAQLRADLAAAKEEVSNNMGEWATLMSDVHDYFADEKADRSAGRVRLVLTLLGMMRIERDQLRADLAAKEADTTRLDWCIKHDAHIWLDDGSLYDRPAKWNVSWYPSGKNQIHEHEDLRSAIEAARSALSSRADKGGST